VGVISTRAGWDALQPHWNGLLEATPGATVFQTFEFQRLWWNHIGWGNGLLFTVALRDDRPVAILPLHIDPRHWLGAEFRTLAFLGDTPESDRPRLLLGPGEDALPAIMAGDLLARADSWDELALAEQAQDDVFVRALYAQLTAAGFHARHGEPSEAPRVVLDGDWTGYLRGRSRALRRTLKRRRLKLERSGHVQYLSVRATAADETPFEQYLRVERASWKHGTHIGVTRDATATSLYREVVSRMAGPFAVEFHFLRRNDRTISATFGITWRDTWYSLQIAHDRACDEWAPGVVLTALELEDAFATRRYRAFDFLSNFLANKTQWANDRIVTRDLHAMRPGPLFSAFYLVYYCWKPALKRAWTRLRHANRRPLPRTRPLVRRDEDEARED
jgi:CelD/BcsL family acetyltransferase involved in cellulose biosynthesis